MTPDLRDSGTSLCLISVNITLSNDDETVPIIYLVPTSGEFHHSGFEALGDLRPEAAFVLSCISPHMIRH